MNHRRTILALVASGRINATEAERLLAACNHGREALWISLLVLLLAASPIHWSPSLGHLLSLAFADTAHLLERFIHLALNLIGGRI